jgi:hypothetical protein
MMTWRERIDKAEATGGHTPQDLDDAKDWITCACGEQDPRIPRMLFNNEPYDKVLSKLGSDFYKYVYYNCYDNARITLCQIEARAQIVLLDLDLRSTKQ